MSFKKGESALNDDKSRVWVGDTALTSTNLFDSLYKDSGIGLGDKPLATIWAFVQGLRDELQVSDIQCEYSQDLSEIFFKMHDWRSQGVTTVTVSFWP